MNAPSVADSPEIALRAGDGVTLRGRSWGPAEGGAPVACVVLVHGLGDCIARHAHVSAALAGAGIAGVMFDQRGHGLSGGRRGHARSYEILLDDLALQIERAASMAGPIFLLGFSFGAQLALAYLLRGRAPGRIAGVVAVAPWLELAFRPRPWRVWLARLADRVAPAFRQKNPIRRSDLSSDTAFIESIEAPGLTHRYVSARLFVAADATACALRESAPEFRHPLLLLHGTDDSTTSWRATRAFHAALAPGLGEFVLLEGCRHEPHCEAGRERTLERIARWIADRAGAADQAGAPGGGGP